MSGLDGRPKRATFLLARNPFLHGLTKVGRRETAKEFDLFAAREEGKNACYNAGGDHAEKLFAVGRRSLER